MQSPTELTRYSIVSWSLQYKNSSKCPCLTSSHVIYNNIVAASTSEGIHLLITFKRRITNAILTIYLPTFLLLSIVYATNFFKDFFFEAVVTVNLTALLVLTTLFISVSSSLPTTSYVKMVDVWLIFAQMVPFIEVLLHTWMDTCRVDADREINHHGTTLEVGKNNSTESLDKVNIKNWVIYFFIICYKMHQNQKRNAAPPPSLLKAGEKVSDLFHEGV